MSVFVGFAFAQTGSLVFGVVTDAFLLPRHSRAWVFFVDSVAVAVVVVAFTIARWVVPVVIGAVPRTEGCRKLL